MNRFVRALLSKWLGNRGEAAASRYLRSRGLRVITTNYRTSRGEIDIIARERDILVFIEVKTRKQGSPAEFVTPKKQQRLILAAHHFLRRHRLTEHRARFDVVSVLWPEGASIPVIQHIPNAFNDTSSDSFRS